MEQHEKREAFFKQAEKNKANFDLHMKLINYHFCDRECKEFSNDIQVFAERQVVQDTLLIALMEYAEKYHEAKLKENMVEELSCKGCVFDKTGNVACINCDENFSNYQR